MAFTINLAITTALTSLLLINVATADLIENGSNTGSVQQTTQSALAIACGVNGGGINLAPGGGGGAGELNSDGIDPSTPVVSNGDGGFIAQVPLAGGGVQIIQVAPDGQWGFIPDNPNVNVSSNGDGTFTVTFFTNGFATLVNNLTSGAVAGDANNADLATVCAEFATLTTINRPSLAFAGEEIAAQKYALTTLQKGHLRNIKTRLVGLRHSAGKHNAVEGVSRSNYDASSASDNIGLSESPWGLFANVVEGFGRRSESDLERGFHHDSVGTTAGIDYTWDDNIIAGLALGYSTIDLNFDGDNGGLDSNSYSVTAYGSYYLDHFYVDGSLGVALGSIDTTRRIFLNGGTTNRTAKGDTDTQQFVLSLGTGFDQSEGALGYGYYAQINWIKAAVDGYTEKEAGGLNLIVDDQNDISSLTSVIGTHVSYVISTPVGAFIPALRAEWAHEFNQGKRSIDTVLAGDATNTVLSLDTDDVDPDSFSLGVSGALQAKNGHQFFADFEASLGDRDFENYVFTLGYRGHF
ncbi:MAG: autotransporter outer membrane beta-barrel domain-containing protein [Methylococcales bacterium]|jgi:uncharacterized protein with beta-barrel porin domain|nr:autotransporter outer membrane beta-barrel domain-containing protein [Methylococcales bacterium]